MFIHIVFCIIHLHINISITFQQTFIQCNAILFFFHHGFITLYSAIFMWNLIVFLLCKYYIHILSLFPTLHYTISHDNVIISIKIFNFCFDLHFIKMHFLFIYRFSLDYFGCKHSDHKLQSVLVIYDDTKLTLLYVVKPQVMQIPVYHE